MKSSKKTQVILIAVLVVLCVLIIIPMWLIFSVAMTNEKEIVSNGYMLWPSKFDGAAYKFIFQNPSSIFNAYKVTIFFSVVGMVLSVLLQSMIAYPLTKPDLKGKMGISFYLYFTMLFGGGLVPTYILITQYLHLGNTIWVYILPSLISPWNIFMLRSSFKAVPNAIFESALIDGASEYRIFFTMVLPLSKPVIATVALLTFLSKWNDWMTSMLYIDNQNLISLQYLLQRIMKNIETILQSQQDYGNMVSISDIPTETVKMAMAVVVMGPALVVFPFFQKYFVKGITVGSVKG